MVWLDERLDKKASIPAGGFNVTEIWKMTCYSSSQQSGLEMQVGLKLFNLLIII